jgi:hypothetical protein
LESSIGLMFLNWGVPIGAACLFRVQEASPFRALSDSVRAMKGKHMG